MRLDRLLVERGLSRSRAQAQALIKSGGVSVEGAVAEKPSQAVEPDQRVEVTQEQSEWVGRGSGKLLHALSTWGEGEGNIGVTGRRCLDIGASTGGFTQVLLAAGAQAVTCVDVGHGQLHPRLAADPRVTERSGLNVRHIGPGDLGPSFDLVVVDVSFISLTLVVPRVAEQLVPGGDAVLLVKPQFEVGPDLVRAGRGLVHDHAAHRRAIRTVVDTAHECGMTFIAVERCAVVGSNGNQEYLVWLRKPPTGMMGLPDVNADIRTATQEARS